MQIADGGAVVVTDAAGSVLGAFPRPWAVDAEGRDVPTRFEVRGSSLVQVVEHAGFSYPVVADPVWMVPVILIGGRAAIRVAVRANTAAAARTAAARAAAAQSGRSVSSTGAATQLSYRAFTASNYRHNLIVKTGKNPSNCQAHHLIPQKFTAQVGGRVNIHDPANLVWWNSTSGLAGNHQSKAYEYNRSWERFFQRYGTNASAGQIQAEKNRLDGIYKNLYRC